MSSTNRKNDRHASDYYVTPVNEVEKFWAKFKTNNDIRNIKYVLDPCAGGDNLHQMSYPVVLKDENFELLTNDIREDSLAMVKGDYLKQVFDEKFDMIIANPPFSHAIEFIKKSLENIKDDGYVIMLLRLNFLGSGKRNDWLMNNMPYEIYVHSKRMSFTDDGRTDSIEYAHFVWRKQSTDITKLYLLDYT